MSEIIQLVGGCVDGMVIATPTYVPDYRIAQNVPLTALLADKYLPSFTTIIYRDTGHINDRGERIYRVE